NGGGDGGNGDGDGENGGGGTGSGSSNDDVQIDPSGYVYEGVTSNRIEGVIATAYYKEEVEDMYGDLHENIVKWDAEEYAQENPLFTDENGYYRWDVPQGMWRVKFEKEGYETTYSEWLPVPPPQLDVNIAMRQNVQPNVKLARAFEDAVEVEFDKYMIPKLLSTDNIFVMQGDQPVVGTIYLVNEEDATEGNEETFASKIRFNAAQPFTEQEITLMVSNRVKSYAGIRMQDDYQQKFTIEQEIKQIVSDSLTVVGYGEEATLTVSVLPASASKGKMLTVKTSSPMILGVGTEQVVIGDDGKAEITLSGELPGIAALTISVEGTDKTALTIASVEQIEHAVVASPTANIASGSVVEKGTEIKLACETEGATIYYTLDGSCPCDETAQRNVYDGTPIVVNESMTIKAMAAKEGMDDSEVATFTYTAVQTGDVNGDGEVNLTDALWIVRHYVGRTPDGFIMNAADIDHSGEVNLSDAQKAVLIFVGKE
ncbi:MAG: chitobiase/beta-hexosaminidase C-terminal domain-containing protein, partial [Prevotella sp.]